MKNGVKVTKNTIIIVYKGVQLIRMINSIRFCKADGRCSIIYFDIDKPVEVPVNLSHLTLLLPKASFYMCHRQYIINYNILRDAIVEEDMILYYDFTIPISRYRFDEFQNKSEAYHTANSKLQ
jgi:DNA-binding LytR/AlgR family response regulator